MDEFVRDVLDDLAISESLYIRSNLSGLPAIIPRPILPTRLILPESPIEIPQTAAQVEASCTFVTCAGHHHHSKNSALEYN